MEKKAFLIETIPSILWGSEADKLLIAVHGKGSSKEGVEIPARIAVEKGYQVLSFDLPEHGERIADPRLCDAQNCREDLEKVMHFASTLSKNISLFGCSLGAYFSMLAYQEAPIQKALFLSPIVDMKDLIENMMKWFDVSETQLEKEQVVATPINPLYWHYYQYVLRHPIKWDKPTVILYGSKDELTEYETIKTFSESCQAKLTILEGGEHYFHTPEQLSVLKKWLRENLSA